MIRSYIVLVCFLVAYSPSHLAAETPEKKASFLDVLEKAPNNHLENLFFQAESSFKKAVAKLSPKERKVASRIYALTAKARENGDLSTLVQFRAEVREWLKVASQKPDSQLQIISTAHQTSFLFRGPVTSKESEAANFEWLVRLEKLLQSDAKLARGLSLKARLMSAANLENLAVIGAYRDCVLADKTDQSCLSSYETAVRSFEALRCPDERVKETLRFFIASEEKAGPFTQKITEKENIFYSLDQPSLDGKDIASARLGLAEGMSPVIFLTFTSQGVAKLTKVTSENVGKYVAITLNGQAISVPKIATPITVGTVQITVPRSEQPGKQWDEAQTLLNSMCSDPQRSKLPETLRLPK